MGRLSAIGQPTQRTVKEAIECYLEGLLMDGLPIPESKDVEGEVVGDKSTAKEMKSGKERICLQSM